MTGVFKRQVGPELPAVLRVGVMDGAEGSSCPEAGSHDLGPSVRVRRINTDAVSCSGAGCPLPSGAARIGPGLAEPGVAQTATGIDGIAERSVFATSFDPVRASMS